MPLTVASKRFLRWPSKVRRPPIAAVASLWRFHHTASPIGPLFNPSVPPIPHFSPPPPPAAGFDQLCRVDPRFQAYRATLFSPSTQTLDRDAQTAELNARLDASVAGFTALLSSYFLLPAATKALEYLVRRFRVHECNVPDLMRAALPYHSTPEFVRLVQIARLEGTVFAFLEPMKASGAVLPRDLLVQRCLTDRGLLRFVAEAAQELGGPRVAARAVMPFFAALLCELVAQAPSVDEALLSMFLPYLLRGLGGDVAPDYRAAIYMLLVQLATRATFSADLCAGLTLELCKSATPAGLPQALLVLCHLAVTQHALADAGLPDNAFKHLAKLPGLAAELRALAVKAPARAQRLVAAITVAAARHLRAHDNYGRLLDELLCGVPLGAAAGAVTRCLLDMAAEEVPAAAAAPVLAALRTLDQRYPAETEKAVNDALSKRGEGGPERERLAVALREAFAGSLRAPMPEAGTTLALAVDAASAGIRRLALERLEELAGGEEPDEEAEAVLRGALLRRLGDDHPAVVQTALGLPSLLRLPPAAVLESLSACLAAALAGAARKDAKKADRADARGVARKIIKLLAGPFAEGHPEDLDRVVELVLSAVLAAPHTRRVAEAAARRGGRVGGHPLLAALAGADLDGAQPAKAGPPATAAKGKRGGKTPKKAAPPAAPAGQGARGYDDAAHNRAVVEALARAVAADADAQAALGRLLGSTEPRARGLALAVANAALRLPGGAPLATQVLPRFTGDGAGPAEDAPAFDSVTGVLGGPALVALASGGLVPGRLEPAVALTALRLLPTQALKDMGTEVSVSPNCPPNRATPALTTPRRLTPPRPSPSLSLFSPSRAWSGCLHGCVRSPATYGAPIWRFWWREPPRLATLRSFWRTCGAPPAVEPPCRPLRCGCGRRPCCPRRPPRPPSAERGPRRRRGRGRRRLWPRCPACWPCWATPSVPCVFPVCMHAPPWQRPPRGGGRRAPHWRRPPAPHCWPRWPPRALPLRPTARPPRRCCVAPWAATTPT